MKKTIIDLFESSVAKYGDRTFLLEKIDGVFLKFAAVFQRCEKLPPHQLIGCQTAFPHGGIHIAVHKNSIGETA